ncbi:hypothetical protein [Bradyrhizobium sp. SZCCHNRI20481]|uniref:hypothetical protein n=1 Tax=Bradyrhizobium sp. SZCCHNRI20481 TaxID=3057286 RepID=UPI002915F8B4|nr:hypothetical protein [Bradyrhizobium sp. SZCCHNRI20481]
MIGGHMKSLSISHDGICVTLHSNDANELESIKACFEYFWDSKYSTDPLKRWSVVSHKVSSVGTVTDIAQLAKSAGLFKDTSTKMGIVDGRHCYLHSSQDKTSLTAFDLANGVVDFYHEEDPIELSYLRNLVREPVAAQYQQTKHLNIHASACSIDSKGILMPGLKGAGKSTLLVHLLGKGARYIANDAVLCTRRDDSLTLTAYPQCVRLSKETIENSKALSSVFVGTSNYNFLNEKFEFLPCLFDRCFPMHQLSFRCGLELILVPSLDLSRNDYSIEFDKDGSNALSLLRQSLFYGYHNYTWSPFFDDLNDSSVDVSNLARVFASLPKVCHLKYGILDDDQQQRLFDDVSEIVT